MRALARESRELEYKREASDLRKLAQTVVAFANGVGGELIIGVEDKKREVIGLPPIELDRLLERLPVSLADQIQPPLLPLIHSRTIDDKEVLVVQVFPGMQKPYFIASEGLEKGVFVRVGAHTRRADGAVLEELMLFHRRLSYDEAPVTTCPLSTLDLSVLPPSLRSEKGLFSLDAVCRDDHANLVHPTRGAVLVLHHEPQRYVPEAEIIISRMRGHTGRDTVESHTINGSLGQQSERALELLLDWLGQDPQLTKGRYKVSKFKLPLVALREALHNALFHRQYSIAGAIKVALFPDRLEIFSPGHFAGPFIPEALGDGTSYIRNKVICLLARRLGLIEKRGTGIKAIQNAMQSAGLPPPLFEEGPNWFKVTLLITPTERGSVEQADPASAILTLLTNQTSISSSDVQRSLKVSRATAVSYLEQLIVSGRIRRVGRGPKTRYTTGGT